MQSQSQLNHEIHPFVVEGSVSLILKPSLRVFAISSFLKVVHTPQNPQKEGVNQVPRKWTSPIAIFISLQSGLPMDLINTPMSRVSCRNDENLENQADQLLSFFTKKRVESGASKINFPHNNFYILAIGTSHGPYKHPHVKG